MEVNLDKTEKIIVEATLRLLENNKINETTTIKIAKEAGVSEVTIFRKFKSKDNLIKITKEFCLNYFLEQIDDIFYYDEDKNIKTLLEDIWWNIVGFIEENINIINIAIDENRLIDDNKIFPQIFDRIITNLTDIFQYELEKGKIRDINPKIAALNIYSVSFQSILLFKIYGKKPSLDFENYVSDFLDIFLNGISIEN